MSTAPLCPHLDRCSGCPSMGQDEHDQRRAKGAHVRRLVVAQGALDRVEVVDPPRIEPNLAYRPRAKWVVGPAGELGLFASEGDHVVVDTPGCLVVDPRLLAAVEPLRAMLRGDGGRLARALRGVDVRLARSPRDGGASVLATLIVRRGSGLEADVRGAARAWIRASSAIAGIAASEVDPASPQLLGGAPTLLEGLGVVEDAAGSIPILAVHGAFVQAHAGVAAHLERALVAEARRVGDRARVLELFAGSGAFGLAVAAGGALVTSVESFAPAAARIEEAARRAGLAVRALASDAERFVVDAAQRQESFDLVIVDPPRRGLPPALRRALARLKPAAIAYVSCSPLTFARDLDHLARLGFAPERVETFDMMPQSDEVESLAIVRPAPRPTLTIAAATEELVAIVVPPHTSPREVERAASNALGSPDVVAVAAIPPDASGLALYARSEASAARARASLELTCTAVVRGIAREKGAIARPARASRDARTRYRRRGTAGGHAVLLLTILGGGDLEAASTHLAWIGHPPLGDERRCDPRTRQHLFERHGLDRSFVHVGGVRVGDELTATCPLAADLEAVLAGLRAATRPTSPRRTSEPARDDP